jgi:hypothetical protein
MSHRVILQNPVLMVRLSLISGVSVVYETIAVDAVGLKNVPFRDRRTSFESSNNRRWRSFEGGAPVIRESTLDIERLAGQLLDSVRENKDAPVGRAHVEASLRRVADTAGHHNQWHANIARLKQLQRAWRTECGQIEVRKNHIEPGIDCCDKILSLSAHDPTPACSLPVPSGARRARCPNRCPRRSTHAQVAIRSWLIAHALFVIGRVGGGSFTTSQYRPSCCAASRNCAKSTGFRTKLFAPKL